MRNRRGVVLVGGLLAVLGLVGWMRLATASPLLTGELWARMSPDAKVAFVWGLTNLVELERARKQEGTADPAGCSFIPYLVKGLRGTTLNEAVRDVDTYYAAHPDQRGRPVVDALFQATVLPRLAGRAEGGRNR